MATSSETFRLAVELRGSGIQETTRDLEGVEDSFDRTADSVGDSAQEMEGFSRKWSGAMKAIMVGLAVAAAGLLSQVPVVGELMSGLAAILEAVAFQIDQVLRPVLSPLRDLMFDLSAAIFEAEGAMGAIIGVVGAVVAGFLILVGVLSAFSFLGGVISTAWGVVVGVFSAVAGVIAAISAPVLLVIAAVAALILIGVALWQNWFGIRDKAKRLWGQITGFVGDNLGKIQDFIRLALAFISGGFLGLLASALTWGRDLPGNFFASLRGAFPSSSRIGAMLSALPAWFMDKVRSAASWGANLVSGWWGALTENFPSGQDILTALKAIPGWFTGIVSDAFNWGVDTIKGWWNAIIDRIPSLGRLMGVFGEFTGFFTGLAGDALGWGRDLIQGWWDGIKAKWDDFIGWFDKQLDRIPGSVRDVLGISSPSRVMMRLGQETVRGFEIGAEPLGNVIGPGARATDILRDTRRQGHAFAGRQEIVIPVMLDGREIARATSRRQRGTFDETGRSK